MQFWVNKEESCKRLCKSTEKESAREREKASVFVCVLFVLDQDYTKYELATLAGS